MRRILYCFWIAGICGCSPERTTNTGHSEQTPLLVAPAGDGGEPNLFISEQGIPYLTWIEYRGDTTDALVFSTLTNNQWSTPTTIAAGSDFFVNWADFPSLAVSATNPDFMAAHWLKMRGAGTYEYDVKIYLSKDGGKNWDQSFTPHRDSLAAEHGFVTLLPLNNGRIFAVWLDGRYAATADHTAGQHQHAHRGAMTLRTAEFDENGRLWEEAELDNRICDCCQTDAVLTSRGPIVVYRDRSESEIRDISIVRKIAGEWTTPKSIFADNWEIAGCPVNGPAIAARGDTIAVAWYSGVIDQGRVSVVFSTDGGAHFEAPLPIDDGAPLGRVDVIWAAETAYVSWMEKQGEKAVIRLAKVEDLHRITEKRTLTSLPAARQSGFPVLEKNGQNILLTWTASDSAGTRIQTLQLPL